MENTESTIGDKGAYKAEPENKEISSIDSKDDVTNLDNTEEQKASNENNSQETSLNNPVSHDEDTLNNLTTKALEESPITEVVVSELQEKNEKLQKDADDYKDRYIRLLAEFENFKKRSLKERSDLIKYQGERIFLDFLDVIDNFDLAIKHLDSDPEQIKPGVTMIHKKMIDILEKWEVRGESGIGKTFDPIKYNAISQLKSEEYPSGTIINELKKAYYYKDRLIRTGEVVVASE